MRKIFFSLALATILLLSPKEVSAILITGSMSSTPATSCIACTTVDLTWTTNNASDVHIIKNGTEISSGPFNPYPSLTTTVTTGANIFELYGDSQLLSSFTFTVNATAPSPSPVPTPTPTPAASSNSSSSTSSNNSSSSSNSSPLPTPTPSPTIRPTYHPTPTPSLLPSPDASGSAVLGAETQPTSTPEVVGAEDNSSGINPLFIIIPTVGLGIGLLAWFFKDKFSASFAQQIANRKRARLEKMITSKQEVSEEPLI